MKTKKTILGVLLFLSVFVCSNFSSSNGDKTGNFVPPPFQPNEFIIGVYGAGYDNNFITHAQNLNMNTWQRYCDMHEVSENGKLRSRPIGWVNCPGDNWDANISYYQTDVNSVISNLYSNGYWAIFQRPKIMLLYNGQSSKYKCKEIVRNDPYREWWYAFDTHERGNNYIESNGDTVWKCTYTPGCTPGYAVKNLRANFEQSASIGQNGMYLDKYYFWYVKPKIKIPANLNPELEVFEIEIISYDNLQKFFKTIKAKNFVGPNGYDGTYYVEEFFDNYLPDPYIINGESLTPESLTTHNYFDIRIKWLGNCDMYIDYVKMESDVADKLFKHEYEQPDKDWIRWEADNIGNTAGAYRHWADEPDYNMLPCVKYLQERMQYYNPNTSLLMTEYSVANTPGGKQSYEMYRGKYDALNQSEVMTASYPLRGGTVVPNTLQGPYDKTKGWLGVPKDESYYEQGIQKVFDDSLIPFSEYGIRYAKERNKIFIFTPQLHLWYQYFEETQSSYQQREPTNEEIEAMTDIMISYGAKGITHFCWNSCNDISNLSTFYCRGLCELDLTPRYENVYKTPDHPGQNKWEKVRQLNQKIKAWGPTLMSLPISNTWSHSYCVDSARSSLIYYSYFNGITTLKPGSGVPQCNEDNIPAGLTTDCPDETYLQVSTMKNSEPYTEYFMIVNRRCFVDPQDTDPHKYGARFVRVRFDANSPSFSGFNNWSIINVEDNSTVGTFDKRNYNSVDLCNNDTWFKPGEGRLYKIVPTMLSGGTLVCDENIQNVNITCNNLVSAVGKNINIGFGTTINFTQDAKFQFSEGSFICGDVNQPNHEKNIIFQSPLNWDGVTLNSCNLVNINSTKFEKIKGEPQITNYALKLYNCYIVNINNCEFTNYEGQQSGAIEANYDDTPLTEPNIYIAKNIFNMNSSDKNSLSIISFAGGNVPVRIYNNYFYSTSNSETAIYLSFVTGIAVKDNIIDGFNKGLELSETDIDFFNNTISSDGNDIAKGISATVNSVVNMSAYGNYMTGGQNTLNNINSEANNIYVNNSMFLLDNGSNKFNISTNPNSLHLNGFFPGEGYDVVLNERKNCFKVNNLPIQEPELPNKDVKWIGNNNDVDFNFFGYDCADNASNTDIVIDAGNYVFDTIQYRTGGNAGGIEGTQVITPKSIYDSLCILLRFRNYSQAKTKCFDLLNTYPDSLQSFNSISKLYQLAVILDTTTSSASNCKTFLTSLILNHPNNLPLVRKCNYYIQKCKVRLKEYQSAMTGFQQIIQQNPYSYEALLASWDYAATHLLDSLRGHSGGVSNEQLKMNNEQYVEELLIPDGSERDAFINDYIEKLDKTMFNDDDKDAFTKEERKTISTSIVTALDDSKKKSKNHIEVLTKKSEKGDNYALVELKVMKTINEVIRIKKPKTFYEHIESVNKDIHKLNTVKNEAVKKTIKIIPEIYNLYQNYPNPFNPVTKINYELPKDGKVKLVIYDILGREIKTLVNEIKQAGRYTVEFNGTQYASGVYFYRIQVEGGKGYTAVKKMVLVK